MFYNNIFTLRFNASNLCSQLNSTLVLLESQIDSFVVENFLSRVSKRSGYWIGIKRGNSKSAFKWTDGSFLSDSHWGPKEPKHDCVIFGNQSMGWNTVDCETMRGYPLFSIKKHAKNAKSNELSSNLRKGDALYSNVTRSASFHSAKSKFPSDETIIIIILVFFINNY